MRFAETAGRLQVLTAPDTDNQPLARLPIDPVLLFAYLPLMKIDHDPEEPKIDRTPGPWRWLWPLVALIWAGYFYTVPMDWPSIAIGLGTGAILATWAIEVTGNKVPDSWKSRKPKE